MLFYFEHVPISEVKMSDKDHESGFHKFRPLCLSLLQKPSIDTLHKLTLQAGIKYVILYKV